LPIACWPKAWLPTGAIGMSEQVAEPLAFEDCFWTCRDGLRLHYRDYPGNGTAPPLLCLPGLTRNARDFEDFAQRHAGRFRVLAPDFRGRASSEYDPVPDRYLPPTYAGEVIELLDQLGVPEAIFIGTSLGGLVTMIVAAIQPQRIAGAVLNDVGPVVDPRGVERIRSYIGKADRFSDWDAAGERIAANSAHVPARFTKADWLKVARRICREADGSIQFDYDMAITDAIARAGVTPNVDLWPLFRALAQKPLLILRGEHSDLLSEPGAAAMLEAAPQAELVTVPGVGHAPYLDELEAEAALDRFLARWA
jgi:pimeloyl-ACP methyl ester carboxylesterase